MSPDHRPWTQIRLGAGTRDASPAPRLSREAANDLIHNVFRLVPGPKEYAADPRWPRGRSSSLRCGRLHLDPSCGPPTPGQGTGTRPNNPTEQPTDPTFT